MKKKIKSGTSEEDSEKMNGGSKKKNGHKKDCDCPICKNMKNKAKHGGSEESSVIDNISITDDKIKPKETKATDEDYDNLDNQKFIGGKTRKKRGIRTRRTRRNKYRKYH